MELVGEVVVLGIVERSVTSPIVLIAGAFYRAPLRLVLRRHLIP